ncbi:PREDICTED: nucleolar MIF4G domain-containing protein 1-like [Amphimedon queenslandica]|uniref:MI domain-containing protein n=1 Tax=Amphimedon queenslandica TaxID=400682 RepID=A0A1X7SWM1_AMPQE|nr:PREDICTED: nucleolar MIF4G domain-containing protein 1-like [Amphimedon queenslandica]|eukprot:XP_019862473.1 PREDICTED: nucleolar MIF4G domain-containing protein 1-like [Amphimedon queenslandica]
MKFLLQVVSAIRTNNVRKIPQHDPTLLEHMKKVLRGLLSGSLNESQAINLSFSELLEASGKGGYWNTTKSLTDLSLTNSGSTPSGSGPAPVVDDGKDDKWIVSLSLEQQMNTDIRRTVFSVIMSSEDYVDAFEKLVKLRLKSIQEREIVFVIVHCSLQENPFNPFYGYLSQKLIKYKRDHQVTFQYCLWDHLKTLSSLTSTQRLNLQCLLSHLIRDRSLSLSVLRVVEYAGMSKVEVEFHKSLLVMIFSGLSDQQLTNFVCSMGENRKDFVKNLYHFVRKQSQEKNTKTSRNIFKRLEELLIETIEY